MALKCSRPTSAQSSIACFREYPCDLVPTPLPHLLTGVPVSLLQVQQRRAEPHEDARDDTALGPAHVPLPAVPGHAQQQGPLAAAPNAPTQRGPRLRGKAHLYCKFCLSICVYPCVRSCPP